MQVLDSGKQSAQENMSLDASLLEQLSPQDPPTLHLYDWKAPSVTYGYFIALDKYLDLKKLKEAEKSLEIDRIVKEAIKESEVEKY